MQVYVSKDGKQYGPYAVEQLLEYVQQGNFTAEDLACHDGQNWVTIAQVPGFTEATQPAVMQDPPSPQQEQAVHEPMSIVFNVLVGLGVLATAGGAWGLLPSPGTGIILGFALSAAGIFCSASHEKQWEVLGMMLMLVGTITAAISIIALTDEGVIGYLIAPVLFLVVSVLGKSGSLAGLAAWSIFHASHVIFGIEFEHKLFPTITIILFAALSLGAYHLSRVFASDYKRLAIIFSRTSLLVVNVGFWIGSVGDSGRDSLLFLTAWAVALVGTGVWAAKNDKRWVVNLSILFGIIAIFSQLFARDILDWDDIDDIGYLIASVLFLVVSVLVKSGALAALAALATFPATWPMVSDGEHIPTVTIILFAALSLGAYHLSKALSSDYKRLAIIFSRTSLFVVNVGFLIGPFFADSVRDRLLFLTTWAMALLGTGLWAAKNDKRWVVNLSAFFGIIAILSQLIPFAFHPLSILIVGLTSLGLAFALVRYNKHAPGTANLKTARTPAKSCESIPARVKTAEVPEFAGGGDSVTTPQRDQVVQEHAVEQQPAAANTSNSPANKKKIILWTGIGGVVTLLVIGLLVWLLGDGKVSELESNPSPAEPSDSKPAQVGKIDLDDPPLGVDAPKVVHPSEIKWQNRHAYFEGSPFTGMVAVKYKNGQKRRESTYKDGELMTVVDWKPNGEKLPEPKLVIITRTANHKNANSDDPSPHAHIIGLDGSRSSLGSLNNIEVDDREVGSTDVFSLPFDYPVSEIQGVELMAKSEDAWRVESISFQFFNDGRKSKPYAFEVNQWFSAAEEKKSLGAIKSKIFSFRPDSKANPSPTAPLDAKPAQVGKIDAQEKGAEAKARPLSNPSPAEPSFAKPAQVGKIDLNDPKTFKKIIANAVKASQLHWRGKEGEELLYRMNQPKPYTGWTKWMYGNGRIKFLTQRKDGKEDGLQMWWYKNGQKNGKRTYKDGQKHGLQTLWYENGQKMGKVTFNKDKKDGLQSWWYENGQKKEEVTYGDGKLITAVGWKPNGEKCPDTNVLDGNGVWVYYNEDGTVERRVTYRDGERVD